MHPSGWPGPLLAAQSGLSTYLPILILLAVVVAVIARLPRIELGHTDAYRHRRLMNWLPLGLTYAFLYMGRYNLTVSKNEFADLGLMTNSDFGVIFGIGTVVYGMSFLLNGPLTDRYGGKRAIVVGSAGAAVMNLVMALVTAEVLAGGPGPLTNFVTALSQPFFSVFRGIRGLFGLPVGDTEASVLLPALSLLYAGNMYFQSFGAVAIVKVNSSWFHVRERGVFGAIFGTLISLGIFLAYDVGGFIVATFDTHYVFLAPAILLTVFCLLCIVFVRDTPGETGHPDFDTGDASSGDAGPQLGAVKVFSMMLRNPVIMTIAVIEFCSGFLRQAIMQWYKIFSKQVGIAGDFVPSNWGMLLCCAGILGGMFAGVISDRVFQSRRGPVVVVLYAAMLVGSIAMVFLLDSPLLGWLVVVLSLCVIGVHGMLSGTASMDFGGRKNAGIAVGIIDGFVYLGTGVMAFLYGWRLPDGARATDPEAWIEWPLWMIPIALGGLVLGSRLWHAKPRPRSH